MATLRQMCHIEALSYFFRSFMTDYTLRDIPIDIHRAWKAASAMKSISMRDYCFVALKQKIHKDIQKPTDGEKTNEK